MFSAATGKLPDEPAPGEMGLRGWDMQVLELFLWGPQGSVT